MDSNMEGNSEYVCNESISRRKLKSQNIVSVLQQRESGLNARCGIRSPELPDFYKCIYPNLTVINVQKPPGFLRKFSPNGQYLIAFTIDQMSVEIYQFNSVSAAGDLLHQWQSEIVPNDNTGQAYTIRSRIFEKLFKLKAVVNIATGGKQLNRECSLFTNDNRYVIVGAASYIGEEHRPAFYDLYTSNDGITPTMRSPLEDYSIYIIDITTGRVSNQLSYKCDKIFLSHNQGIYLYNNIFAVLSVQHQTIYIYEIIEGKFYNVLKLGRFCSDEEAQLYNSVIEIHAQVPIREATIGSLKHRLLVFLYNSAVVESKSTRSQYPLRKFYKYFDQYRQLRMWKMQLCDENILLVKYASESVVTLKAHEPNSHPAIFMFYSMWDGRVLAVYDNTSDNLLNIYENLTDRFRNTWMNLPTRFSCTPNNNLYARVQHNRFKQTIVSARGGGNVEATKRLLTQLPIPSQSYSNSPYLDFSVFSYDDKWVSMLERPKACGEYPIRFFARDSGLLKFRICPGLQDRRTQPSRRLVAFTFHPYEPFAISVQRIDNDYVVNFHIRNCETVVAK